jgi:hypothetical protein
MELLRLKKKMTNKIAIYFLCVALFGCRRIQVENYFIPRDFKGNIAVIHNNTGRSSNGVYNYHIPQSGILTTDCCFEEGKYITNYYQKNSFDGFDTLMVEYPSTKLSTTKNRIYFYRVLTFKRNSGKEVYVSTFYVGNEPSYKLEKERIVFERFLESTILGN